jgi:ribosome biogenesis GTPase A
MICDCPGLVFPSFVNSKNEMYCCGVLPVAQLREHVGKFFYTFFLPLMVDNFYP